MGPVTPVLNGRADLEVLESSQGSATDPRPPAGPCRVAVVLSGGMGVRFQSVSLWVPRNPVPTDRGAVTLPSNQANIWASSC